jgi:outer membrane lipoprotein-sorting protein
MGRIAAALLIWIVSAQAAAAAAPQAGELTLELLMTRMAATSGVVAAFVEQKEIQLLREPLETRGHLYFVPPDRLARITESPGATRLVISGGQLEFRDEAGSDSVDLSDNPMARQFVDNFIVLFSGDLAELQRRYTVDFSAGDGAWQLLLTPRRAPLRDLIRSISLKGRGQALHVMELIETDGDRTHTRFDSIEVDHRFSTDEIERYFSADPPGEP